VNNRIIAYMDYHPIRTQRGLEILAGMVPWAIITFLVVGSFFFPEVVAYFLIVFSVYWLYRSLQLAVNSTIGYLNLKATEKIHWMEKLKTDPNTKEKFKDLYHMVCIPNVKEPTWILLRNVQSLAEQSFDPKKIFVVLAMEEREGEGAKQREKEVREKFKNVFAGIITTYHPLIIGETIGKHSNNAFAARHAKEVLTKEKKIPIENVLLTTCDVDSVFPKDYMALLTHKFLLAKKPYQCFFQAALFMYNNLEKLPLLARLPNIMSGIFFLSLLPKVSGRLMNWSTYSASLKLIDQIGYWDIDVIPEDWHINLKAFFYTKDNVEVIPMYLPVYIDAAESTSRMKTYKNYYSQVKRWAWGIVDVPYVVKMFFRHPEIPFWKRLYKISWTFEWHFLWSSSWFLVTLGATIPTVLNPNFARTALGFNLSRVSSGILTICLVGILSIIVIDVLVDPKRNKKFLALIHPFTYLQWIFLPVIGLVFGLLPGLESQTRLMLGKYLEYKVTEKV